MQTLSSDGTQKMCPSSAEKVIYIGRTEYTINMFDSKTGSKRYGTYGCQGLTVISLLSNWIGLLANRTRSLMTLLMSCRWNATFMDYSSHVGEVKEYG